MNKVLDWCGVFCLSIAPFLINGMLGKMLAIAGLIMLSFQAVRLKAINLIALNTAGIVGYVYSGLFS